MVNIEQLERLYFVNNKPVPYKLSCGVEILIHPISVGDWSDFSDAMNCLIIRKEEMNSVEVLSMKYMDFLLSICSEDNGFYDKLKRVIKYSFKENYIDTHVVNKKNHLAITTEQGIIKYIINAKEFNDIKSIILYQNIHDYDDRYISPDVRKAMEDYERIKNKGVVSPTLEKKKVFVMSMNGMSEKKINKMSYRAFSQIYNSMVSRDIYIIQNIIKASPKYEIKEEVIHPVFRVETDRLTASFVEKDTVENKIKKQ